MARPEVQRFLMSSLAKVKWDAPIIDLGAGNEAYRYRRCFPGKEYITLDREQNDAGDIDIVADMLNMPQVKSDSYGVVLLLETLEHVADPFRAFAGAARILKVGGVFICTTVACWPEHDHPVDYWRFLPAGLELLCHHCNLRIFYQEFIGVSTCTPSHSCVAAMNRISPIPLAGEN